MSNNNVRSNLMVPPGLAPPRRPPTSIQNNRNNNNNNSNPNSIANSIDSCDHSMHSIHSMSPINDSCYVAKPKSKPNAPPGLVRKSILTHSHPNNSLQNKNNNDNIVINNGHNQLKYDLYHAIISLNLHKIDHHLTSKITNILTNKMNDIQLQNVLHDTGLLKNHVYNALIECNNYHNQFSNNSNTCVSQLQIEANYHDKNYDSTDSNSGSISHDISQQSNKHVTPLDSNCFQKNQKQKQKQNQKQKQHDRTYPQLPPGLHVNIKHKPKNELPPGLELKHNSASLIIPKQSQPINSQKRKELIANKLLSKIKIFEPIYAMNIVKALLNSVSEKELLKLLHSQNEQLLTNKIFEISNRIKQIKNYSSKSSTPSEEQYKNNNNKQPLHNTHNNENISQQILENMSIKDAKLLISKYLYPLIENMEPNYVKQIIPIMMEMDNYDLLQCLNDKQELKYHVNAIGNELTQQYIQPPPPLPPPPPPVSTNNTNSYKSALSPPRTPGSIHSISSINSTSKTSNNTIRKIAMNQSFPCLPNTTPKKQLKLSWNKNVSYSKSEREHKIDINIIDKHKQESHNKIIVNNKNKNNNSNVNTRDDAEIDKQIVDNEDEYSGLPSICSIQVLRVIVNTIIPKQIFELLLESKCIENPNSKQKIFLRCHKSHYHENSTVLYIHFINFDSDEYEYCRDQYFYFMDENDKRILSYNHQNRINNNYNYNYNTNNYNSNNNKKQKRRQKNKKNIFDIMGNQLGLIKVYKAKEYDPFRANIHYLSRIVNICLRCKINKAAPRKRVCTFCIVDDRNDRVKIAEYYNNPEHNVKHKTEIEIQKDLIEKLKIELNLIPLVYRSECNNVDVETGKCSSKGASKCSFIHNEKEKIFGDKLFSLRQNAIKRQYKAQGEFELNDYDAVKLQLFYRKIIGQYYNIWWKHSGNTIEKTRDNMDKIKQYLIDKNIKLYLIPTVYKNWCYYAKDIDPICSRKSHHVCTFIHDEKQSIFGDILWRIKYDALEEREITNNQQQINNQQQEITTHPQQVNLLDEDENKSKNIDEKIDLEDKWWKDTINPYNEANEEEHAADKDLAEKWRMDSANIYIQAEEMEYLEGRDIDSDDDDDDDEYIYSDTDSNDNNDNNDQTTILKHTLYVEYEDIKSAKIKSNRTYVDFTFKCKYKVNFEEINCEQEIRKRMEKCDLISRFMHESKSVADWLRSNITNIHTGQQDRIMNRIYRNYKSRIHILNIIASFAVIKDKTYPKCVACYFNICDGIKHKLLKNGGHLQIYRNCCDGFDNKRIHDFDTRRCDQLHGVVVEKLMPKIDINSNQELDSHPRYKVLINRKTTNIDTYLKFLVIGSNKYNTFYRNRRNFSDVLVSYPCNTHQFIQIQKKLKLLYNDEHNIHRKNEITQIIFGYNAIKPSLVTINPYERNIDRKLIKKLFRRLNSSQIDAIYGALNYNMHSIQGPPATGKTKTCAHIAYLWWMNGYGNQIKIHGMAPTNQGTLLLAQKCMEMNDIMEERPSLDANRLIDGFIRMTIGIGIEKNNKRLPSSIRDLCLKFYYDDRNSNDKSKPKRKFKVLYFASKTYTNILDVKLASQKKNALQMNNKNNSSKYCGDGMTIMERLCVNLAAINKCRQQADYSEWGERKKESWMRSYILSELKSADMICTTFGNSTHKIIRELFEYEFTHAICDESNQSSLDTFLGIGGYENLQHLCMAGDIKQLAPVTKSQNELACISVYEHIIEYLTDMTFIPNKYYTRLNKQYRSHPQIYNITTSIFYNKTVDVNNDMKYIRSYIKNKKNYCQLFGNKNNHIQFHILTNIQKQIDTSSQRHSKYNVKEVRIAVKYLRKFIIEYGYSENDIAVISDYSAQIDCLYDHLIRIKQINSDKILLCTTNEIEGSSKPIVIYMCCRSNNTGNIGFLNDITRINVATSRAEYGQIIIGDIYTLQYNPIYKQIFDIHQKCGAVVYEESISIKESINKPISINQKQKHKKKNIKKKNIN